MIALLTWPALLAVWVKSVLAEAQRGALISSRQIAAAKVAKTTEEIRLAVPAVKSLTDVVSLISVSPYFASLSDSFWTTSVTEESAAHPPRLEVHSGVGLPSVGHERQRQFVVDWRVSRRSV